MGKRKEKKHFLAIAGSLKTFKDLRRIPTLLESEETMKRICIMLLRRQFFIQNNTKNLNMIRWYNKMITNPKRRCVGKAVLALQNR